MENNKELSTILNGKLNCILMKAEVRQSNRKESTIVKIEVTLNNKGKIDDMRVLSREKVTVKVKLGNRYIDVEDVNIDFTQRNLITISKCEEELYFSESVVLPLEIHLIVSEPKSHFVETTILKGLIPIYGLVNDKLFIDLFGNVTSTSIICNYIPTVEADFFEYKVNTDDWIKLKDSNFTVPKRQGKMFIQVRGKYKGVYSYSNVIKINNELY